jgi:hypothetical protein
MGGVKSVVGEDRFLVFRAHSGEFRRGEIDGGTCPHVYVFGGVGRVRVVVGEGGGILGVCLICYVDTWWRIYVRKGFDLSFFFLNAFS